MDKLLPKNILDNFKAKRKALATKQPDPNQDEILEFKRIVDALNKDIPLTPAGITFLSEFAQKQQVEIDLLWHRLSQADITETRYLDEKCQRERLTRENEMFKNRADHLDRLLKESYDKDFKNKIERIREILDEEKTPEWDDSY